MVILSIDLPLLRQLLLNDSGMVRIVTGRQLRSIGMTRIRLIAADMGEWVWVRRANRRNRAEGWEILRA